MKPDGVHATVYETSLPNVFVKSLPSGGISVFCEQSVAVCVLRMQSMQHCRYLNLTSQPFVTMAQQEIMHTTAAWVSHKKSFCKRKLTRLLVSALLLLPRCPHAQISQPSPPCGRHLQRPAPAPPQLRMGLPSRSAPQTWRAPAYFYDS